MKKFLGDLSVLQVFAGALAAMTAAWLASKLGVAGTIIGAAVGSMVASISTALYMNTLSKGRTLLVTESGTVIQQTVTDEPRTTVVHGETEITAPVDASGEPGEIPDGPTLAAPGTGRLDGVLAVLRHLRWRTVAILTGAILALSLVGIAAFELASGQSFGNAENSGIVRPGSPGASPAPSRPAPEPTTTPTTPTTAPTTVPTVTPSTEPTTEPSAGPTPDPTTSVDPEAAVVPPTQ